MREEVIRTIGREKIIVIMRGMAAEDIVEVTGALVDGGIRLIEVTFRQDAPDTWQATAEGIRQIAKRYAGTVCVGAGTVMTPMQVDMAHDAGARYIASPNVQGAVMDRTRALGLVSLPGAMTPTEIASAHEQGADFVKVFPAGILTAAYFKAVKAPLAHIPLFAFGGVTPDNASEYMDAGAAGIGVAGKLLNQDWINSKDWSKIAMHARLYTGIIHGGDGKKRVK